MSLVEIEVDGIKRNLYVDTRLWDRIQRKIIPKINQKDNDWVWVVDGAEGAGKSVFAQQIAKLVDPTFDTSRMCMTPQEFTTAILKAKKGQAVIFDEAFTGLSSRQSLAEVNRLIVSLMMEMRQKN